MQKSENFWDKRSSDYLDKALQRTISYKRRLRGSNRQATGFPPWRPSPSIEALRSIYDAAAERWQENIVRIGQLRDYRLLFESQEVGPYLRHIGRMPRILDCGIGTGAFSLAFLASVCEPVRVSGVDISHQMLAHARRTLESRCAELDLRCGDVRDLPFEDESFDAVLFSHVLEYVEDPEETVREMVRVLKPGCPMIGSVTRKGPCQAVMSIRWRNTGYRPHQLTAFFRAAELEDVMAFDYGSGWSKWMCTAVAGVKPR